MGMTGELWRPSGEKRVGTSLGTSGGAIHSLRRAGPMDPQYQRACLMRAVNSCTRLYTDRSSRMSFVILSFAWMTVV